MKSGQVPSGDKRFTMNMNKELHFMLKVTAAKLDMSMGDLVEKMLRSCLDNLGKDLR